MQTVADSESMTAETLLKMITSGVEALYRDNTDPHFDACPMLFLKSPKGVVSIIALAGGEPPVIAHAMVKLQPQRPVLVGMLSPTWMKDPVDRTEVIGESIAIVIETADTQEFYTYPVTRDLAAGKPPVLGELIKAASCAGRMTGLIYRPTEH